MLIDTNDVIIPTWTEPEVLSFLEQMAKRSTHAVELGTYFGASARTMLKANPKLHLWCVDKFDVFGSRKIAELFLKEWILTGRCELITGDSSVAASMLGHMKGKIDACFVDDGHEDWQVLADIKNFLPLMSSGGVLCGHDWDGDNDVARGVKQSGIQYDIPFPRLWRYVKP